MATEIFKGFHGSTPIYIRNLFEEKDKIYNLRSTVSLKQPKCNTVTYALISFWYKGATIWNYLPNKIKISITLAEFKNKKFKKMARTKVSLQYVHKIAVECSWSKTH